MKYTEFIIGEFERRKEKNRRFSLRAFALLLEVDASLLSKIMAGKRQPSRQLIESTCQKLGVADSVCQGFLSQLEKSSGRLSKVSQQTDEETQTQISWYLPILFEYLRARRSIRLDELIKKLHELFPMDVDSLVETIQSMGLIFKEDDMISASVQHIQAFSEKVTAGQKKEVQKTYLELAKKAMDQVDFNKRHHSTLTMALDQAQMEEIKKLIQEFQRKMMKISARQSGKAHAVYNMTLALYPTLQF